LQVRAWDARLGSTYEEVSARGIDGYGESPLFYAQGNGISPNGVLPAPLIGLRSFSLRPALAVLISGITRQGEQVLIEWRGGFKQYQLQKAITLGQSWQNVGDATTNLSYTASITNSNLFFRVVAFID